MHRLTVISFVACLLTFVAARKARRASKKSKITKVRKHFRKAGILLALTLPLIIWMAHIEYTVVKLIQEQMKEDKLNEKAQDIAPADSDMEWADYSGEVNPEEFEWKYKNGRKLGTAKDIW